jgi:hypothetical protein
MARFYALALVLLVVFCGASLVHADTVYAPGPEPDTASAIAADPSGDIVRSEHVAVGATAQGCAHNAGPGTCYEVGRTGDRCPIAPAWGTCVWTAFWVPDVAHTCPAGQMWSNAINACQIDCSLPGAQCSGGVPDPQNCAAHTGEAFNGVACNADGCVQSAATASDPVHTMCHVPEGATGNSGCAVTGDRSMGGCSGGKCSTWISNPRMSGAACTTAVTPSADAPSGASGTTTGSATPALPPGKCSGTFNGNVVVHDCATTSEATGSTSTKSVGTSTSTVTGPDPVTEKSTAIECTGSLCTKTVTTTTSKDGVATTDITATVGSKADICAGEKSATCGTAGTGTGDGGNGSFSGQCGKGWSCDGDAAMCATAKAASDLKCSLYGQDAIEKNVYDTAAAAGTATGVTTESRGVGVDAFDSSNALGSSACVTDQTFMFPAFGTTHSVVLPFSRLCDILNYAGLVLMGVAFLIAARIAFGGR